MLAARAGIVLVLVAAVVAGCGSGTAPDRGVTRGQQKLLVTQLEAVRSAASADDYTATRAAVAKFRASVVRLRRAGAISAAAAHELRLGAARVLQRAKSDSAPAPAPAITPTATTTATTPAPAPAAPPGKAKGHHKKDHGPGHGHGHGKKGKD